MAGPTVHRNARDAREGDGTRDLNHDQIRDKFDDRLKAGELEKPIQQIQKLRGERNKQKRKKGDGFPFDFSSSCGDDDEDD